MLTGKWRLLRGEQNGEEETQEVRDRSNLEIEGDRHTVTFGDVVLAGTHSLDATQDPKTIDAVDSVGPFEGLSLKGIFRIDDDVFTVCFAAPDEPRPTSFTTKDGKATMMHVWKRVS
jgi:uncharacterized protein (TIGR03067 family)